MAQVGTSKEISGKKMGFIVIGTIIAATIAIVIAIQAFYMTWDPKQKKTSKMMKQTSQAIQSQPCTNMSNY